MQLAGALRAFAGATGAWRQTVAAASKLVSAGRVSGGGLVMAVSETTATASAMPLGLRPAFNVWRCNSSLAVAGAEGGSTPSLVLRGADDEAMSPHPPTTGSGPLTVRYPFNPNYYSDTEAVVYSLDEQPMGLIRMPGAVYNVPVRIDILHRVARFWRAKWQQGTHKTKTRGEVRGGGRKPWNQKKTGRARQGSIRSPLWKGGGTTFGPRPRSHAHKLPRAVMALGMRCALSAKVNEGRLYVVDDFLALRDPESAATSSSNPQTVHDYRELKGRVEALTAGSYGSTWLLVDSDAQAASAAGARLRKMLKPSVLMKPMSVSELTAYHLLQYHRVVLSRAAAEALGEALSAPHKVTKPVKHAWWGARQAVIEATVRELNEAAEARA